MLAGTQQSVELKLALDQEQLKSKKLEESMRKLDEEMKRTDELLYQMIPKQVADRLRNGESPIDTCEVRRIFCLIIFNIFVFIYKWAHSIDFDDLVTTFGVVIDWIEELVCRLSRYCRVRCQMNGVSGSQLLLASSLFISHTVALSGGAVHSATRVGWSHCSHECLS